jgi:hypothetical protein
MGSCGPTDQNLIVSLPEGSRLADNELRPTIAEIKSLTLEQLRTTMNDPTNWVGLLAHNRESTLPSNTYSRRKSNGRTEFDDRDGPAFTSAMGLYHIEYYDYRKPFRARRANNSTPTVRFVNRWIVIQTALC